MKHVKELLKKYIEADNQILEERDAFITFLELTDELQEAIEQDEKENGWIPVSERLPEEHDSIFAKFKGTDNWKRGMFEKTSKYVIATVVFDDGTVLVEQAHTTDGIWRTDKKVLGGTVVAWMDYPKPYKEDRS